MLWDALGRQVAGRNYLPTNKNTLIRALTEEWDKLPQQLLDNVVQSMVRRVECCNTLHGGHIPTSPRLGNRTYSLRLLFKDIGITNVEDSDVIVIVRCNSEFEIATDQSQQCHSDTTQDFPAETVFKKISDSVATPSCHVRPTNQDTLSQAGSPTSGHIHNLDMGWRNASRSVSQRRPASSAERKLSYWCMAGDEIDSHRLLKSLKEKIKTKGEGQARMVGIRQILRRKIKINIELKNLAIVVQ
ncbi:hypothetical protein TNCV_775101 [Trichonephila clavipes]|nr:hypothetical protein TNCV_775101 [Trichonephila clavipes]